MGKAKSSFESKTGINVGAAVATGGVSAIGDLATGGSFSDNLMGGVKSVGDFVTGQGARDAAREDRERAAKAVEEAKKLEVTNTLDSSNTSTSQTTFDPKSQQESNLLNSSINNFGQQQQLANQFEKSIMNRQGVQNQAQGSLGGILSGDAFGLTADENQRIQALTGAQLAQGSSRVDDFLNERLGQLNASAAQRGVRGQAFSQLQTGAVSEAADQLTQQQLAANTTSAQLALEMPGQRVGTQANVAGQFANFADLGTTQAMQNREQLQNPAALQMLRDERLASGKTSNTNTSSSTSVNKGGAVAGMLQHQVNQPGAAAANAAATGQAIGNAVNIGAKVYGATK